VVVTPPSAGAHEIHPSPCPSLDDDHAWPANAPVATFTVVRNAARAQLDVFSHENEIHPPSLSATTFAQPVTSPVIAFTRARQPPVGCLDPHSRPSVPHVEPTQIHPAERDHANPEIEPLRAMVAP
jgi:hypothetical protein